MFHYTGPWDELSNYFIGFRKILYCEIFGIYDILVAMTILCQSMGEYLFGIPDKLGRPCPESVGGKSEKESKQHESKRYDSDA